MNKLFSFINKDDNNKLSKMKEEDLNELFNLLQKYKLEYRDTLNLDSNISFGTEIEFEFANKSEVLERMVLNYADIGWYVKPDKSLYFGLEITSPILTDNQNTWIQLKDMCTLASNNGVASIHSGAHVHVDNRVLKYKKENVIKLLKIFSAYENVIFRFGNGEYINCRQKINQYAEPIAQEIYFTPAFESSNLTQEQIDGIIYQLKRDRFKSLNINNTVFEKEKLNAPKNTVEFRSPNGTLNPIIWQNNINFITKLAKYATNNNYDEDTIRKRMLINSEIMSNIYDYNIMDIDGALELVDLIFDNNLDKLYFLRQYTKDLRQSRSKNLYLKSKSFTK